MIVVTKYSDSNENLWNNFVATSKNSTFLINRKFMEYHSDRFVDHSIMIYNDGQLVAVMPASEHGKQIKSHGGLTYGGVVCGSEMSASLMLDVIIAVVQYYRNLKFETVLYKPTPYVYHRIPASEDLYALFRINAQLARRDVAACIDYNNRPTAQTRRMRGVKKSIANEVAVGRSSDWSSFIDMHSILLKQKYRCAPAHTAQELEILAAYFPDNVKLYTATRDGELLAGIVLFDCGDCVHAQYISSSERGRQLFALDGLFDILINKYSDRRWFDFGISTEQAGRTLNVGLADNKESWGARSIVYDHYLINLNQQSLDTPC